MEQRRIAGSGFDGDTGEADAALTQALADLATGSGEPGAVLAALQPARLLVPVVAVLGDVEYDEAGLAHDKSSDMAVVLMTGADGRLALLAFTSTATMRAWDPEARPVPVSAPLAATSAISDDAAAMVIDIAGPVPFVVEGDDLTALADGWTPVRMGEQWAWIRPEGS